MYQTVLQRGLNLRSKLKIVLKMELISIKLIYETSHTGNQFNGFVHPIINQLF